MLFRLAQILVALHEWQPPPALLKAQDMTIWDVGLGGLFLDQLQNTLPLREVATQKVFQRRAGDRLHRSHRTAWCPVSFRLKPGWRRVFGCYDSARRGHSAQGSRAAGHGRGLLDQWFCTCCAESH